MHKVNAHYIGNDCQLCLQRQNHTKTVKYNQTNNLLIMYTTPSANKFRSFLSIFCFEKRKKNNNNNNNMSHDDDEFISGNGDTEVNQTDYEINSKFTNYHETLNKSQIQLLKWYRKISHHSLRDLQEMAKLGILPKATATCDIPMYAHCQFVKAHKRAKSDNNITNETIKHSGDLFHMDKEVSSIP